MNLYLKYGISALIGTVVGSAVSAIICKKHYERVEDEHVQEFKQQWLERHGTPVVEVIEEIEESQREESLKDHEMADRIAEEAGYMRNSYHRMYDRDKNESPTDIRVEDGWTMDYTSRASFEDFEEDTLDTYEQDIFEEKGPDITPNVEPYVISREEFQQNAFGFDHGAILYWRQNNELTDEDSHSVDMEVVGGRAIEELKAAAKNDITTIFVRNPKYKTDYELIMEERDFYETFRDMEFG